MSTPATLGYWTAGVARLSERGEVSPTGATDTYTVYWPTTDDAAHPFSLSDVTSGLPDEGDAHPANADLTVAEFRIQDHEPGVQWRRISVVYTRGDEESESGSGGSSSIGKLTALDYPVYTQSGDLVCDQASGAPVLNSAGDVFDSVPTVEALYTGVHWTRRLSSWSAVSPQLALSGTVNSAAVTIYGVSFAKRTARLRITARNTFDGSSRPWELDVTVEPRHTFVASGHQYRPDSTMAAYDSVVGRGYDIGWDVAILDCGFQYIDPATTPPQKIRFTVVDEAGNESAPQLPQLLTATGEDGRAYGSQSFLVVKTCAGDAWSALKFKPAAPN